MPIPRIKPPITAPNGLSNPPTTAAVKATIKIKSKELGDKLVLGVISSPANDPATPDIAQLKVRIRLTFIPLNLATSGFNAAARIPNPTPV